MSANKESSLRGAKRRGNLMQHWIASAIVWLRNDKLVVWLLLIIFSLIAILPTLHQGFFVADDGPWMIIRYSAFHQALHDGQFPVRFLERLNYGYGYPVVTFLYPGYLYFAELIHSLGFGFVDTIKIVFALCMFGSGIFAYLWLSKVFDKWAAFVGALVYLYIPYHLVDMYKRGSLGELMALAVLPFVLWQLERKSTVFSSIGISLLVLSHNIMAVLFLPLLFFYAVMRTVGKFHKRIITNLAQFLFGLGIASFFWLPALYELHYTIFSQIRIFDWRNYFAPYSMVGGLPVILLIASILLLLFQNIFTRKNSLLLIKKNDSLFLFFVIVGYLSMYLSSAFSKPLWHILPVTFIQFPFRFLSLEIPAFSFIAAFLLYSLQNKLLKIIFACVIVLSLAINAFPYFRDIHYFDHGERFYTTSGVTTTSGDEYMPIWVKQKPLQEPKRKVSIMKGEGELHNVISNSKMIEFETKTQNNSIIQANTIYWPGWKATIDGKDTKIDYKNAKGVMTVSVPKGEHEVRFRFHETPLRLSADVLSIVSFIALIIYCKLRNAYRRA